MIAIVSGAIATYRIYVEHQLPLGSLISLGAAIIMLVWMIGKKHPTPLVTSTMCALLVLTHLVACYFKGLPALLLVSPYLVMLHLLLRPMEAMALGVTLVAGSMGFKWLSPAELPTEIWLRLALVNTGMLIVLQISCRYWHYCAQGFRNLSRDMIEAQQAGQRALEDSKTLLSDAIYTDRSTGLPNRQGFTLLLRNQLANLPKGDRAAVLAWGFAPRLTPPLKESSSKSDEFASIRSGLLGEAEIVGVAEENLTLVFISAYTPERL